MSSDHNLIVTMSADEMIFFFKVHSSYTVYLYIFIIKFTLNEMLKYQVNICVSFNIQFGLAASGAIIMEPSRCITVRPKPPPVNFQWKYASKEVLYKYLYRSTESIFLCVQNRSQGHISEINKLLLLLSAAIIK